MVTSLPLRRLAAALLLVSAAYSHAADPTVSNVRAAQKTGTKQVEIYYDLSGSTSPVFVSLQVSSDGGTTFAVPANALTGHVGAGVSLGKNKKITWNAGADWNNQLSNTVKFRVTASETPPITGEFALIPAGWFEMGDAFGEGWTDERPVHSVYVSAFYMGRYEVTKELWDEVRAWGLNHGYTDLLDSTGLWGAGNGPNYPVEALSWHEIVKWCNARSEKENRTPCYRVDGAVHRTGWSDAVTCNWNADGYRLPTEAEWEKAARGGLGGKRFPWGNTISHTEANFWNVGGESYQTGTTGPHPLWFNNTWVIYSSPLGSFAPNGYGLYDMAGNVWEWCWDLCDDGNYYNTAPSTNPRGPDVGQYGSGRVIRGGGWISDARGTRCAGRNGNWPDIASNGLGFRLARGQP